MADTNGYFAANNKPFPTEFNPYSAIVNLATGELEFKATWETGLDEAIDTIVSIAIQIDEEY